MSQLKRSILIAILIVSGILISFLVTFINYHIIAVILKIVVLFIGFVVAGLILQSREKGIDTIVRTTRNNKE
ncbi:hypothetical protein P5618_029580 (plasmid) [Priestia megaterium]|uniref:hypothetical protein n=1 Tax=Priestia megaterium TaxID=1404 RepID=UPI000BF27E72|nr:hypothetical protein [Priestia megaterium]MDH3177891.1 hypothetical protein [Priestia megaterium]MDH3177910.1 hypothetical protein [Priestia megaterium]MEE3896991.1 hypothetical protein [Priestia megaterium]PFB01845.1 hypothetical protein CN383_11090 [Priestia megaterium]